MSGLNDLYQEILLEHNSKPRNFKSLEDANQISEGYNPLCGDQITLALKVVDGVIDDVGFQGSGCAISRASASMMTEAIMDKSIEEARKIFDAFHNLLTSSQNEDVDVKLLGDLEFLGGVVQYPVRIKCATLSWHTLGVALDSQQPGGQTVLDE